MRVIIALNLFYSLSVFNRVLIFGYWEVIASIGAVSWQIFRDSNVEIGSATNLLNGYIRIL